MRSSPNIIQAKLSSTECKAFLKGTIFLLHIFNKHLHVIHLNNLYKIISV